MGSEGKAMRMRGNMAMANEGGALSVKDPQIKEKASAVKERQRVIGRELRRMYDEVVQEAVPEDFLSLLKKIDENKEDKA
jgi:hypothetical protein